MDDLEAAHRHYLAVVASAVASGDWQPYVDLLAADAVYRRTGMPDRTGRAEILAQVEHDTGRLPGALIVRVELTWASLDRARDRVVQEMAHVARDPGDGSEHLARATSTLHRGAEGMWDSVDVVHSREAYRAMYRGWARAARACGNEAAAEALVASLQARETP